MSNFQAVSVRLGEIHLEDLVPQIGELESFEVLAFDPRGTQLVLPLRLTQKWGGAWQRALECPRCLSPARVLAVVGSSGACGRCFRRPTEQSRRKNAKEWSEGALADELARGLLKPGGGDPARQRAVARNLWRRSIARAEGSLTTAVHAIARGDQKLEARVG